MNRVMPPMFTPPVFGGPIVLCPSMLVIDVQIEQQYNYYLLWM